MQVYVGISGGVDSSVTAALLKDAGHEVTGVYMKNWTEDVLGFKCPWRQDLTDAQSVAARLKIPLKIYDFQAEYKQKVVDYMVAEYRQGRTPNPDIMCNQEIKFKLFLETALSDGAERIATGHYARIQNSQLHTGLDSNKDQSYFLYRLSAEALSASLMPLGEKTKPEVRALAKQLKLPTANKPDSQGICFIGEVGIEEFLSRYIETEPGPVKTAEGKVVGEHKGAALYTIGQRRGLGVGGGLPYYVIAKDMATNTVFVTTNLQDMALNTDSFEIHETHWINGEPDLDRVYQLRTRYRGRLSEGRLKKVSAGKYLVKLKDPERALAPGQSAVVYAGSHVLGGGIIQPLLDS